MNINIFRQVKFKFYKKKLYNYWLFIKVINSLDDSKVLLNNDYNPRKKKNSPIGFFPFNKKPVLKNESNFFLFYNEI